MIKEVYADHAAHTPMLDIAKRYLNFNSYNPNSSHARGRLSNTNMQIAKHFLAHEINCDKDEIYYTSGATDACALALRLMKQNCTAMEVDGHSHHAVWDYPFQLEKPFSKDAKYKVGHALILANNETGEIYDIPKYGDSDLTFVDATAALGHMKVDVKELGCNYLCGGAHKFGGAIGIGFLYIKKGSPVPTYPVGTQSVALALGMGSAIQNRMIHLEESLDLADLNRSYFLSKVSKIWNIKVHESNNQLKNIISIAFKGIKATELVSQLDMLNVFCSAGSACNSHSDEPSRVLLYDGYSEEEVLSTVRFSFCETTTQEELDFVIDALKTALEKLSNL